MNLHNYLSRPVSHRPQSLPCILLFFWFCCTSHAGSLGKGSASLALSRTAVGLIVTTNNVVYVIVVTHARVPHGIHVGTIIIAALQPLCQYVDSGTGTVPLISEVKMQQLYLFLVYIDTIDTIISQQLIIAILIL